MTEPVVPGADGPLAGLLREAGATEGEITAAVAHGQQAMLAIERLVQPGEGEHDLTEVSQASGLSVEWVAQLWRSLGFVEPRPGDRSFHAADIELLTTIARLLDLGIVEDDLVVQMARVIGSSQARVASALLDALSVDVGPGQTAADEAERIERESEFVSVASVIVPTLHQVMELVWARHVQVMARARISREASEADPDHRAVGFADLVGFTALSQQVTSRELAMVVDRFEAIAYDAVTRLGGRVVKMIGDEVMFTVDDELTAAEMALTLADTYRDDHHLSDVRVGLASGPVLQREADLFGPVVNRASRIVSIAHPGSVVCDQSIRDALADDPRFGWKSIGNRSLKNIGRVQLHVLRRADGPHEESSRRAAAEARRSERREARLSELAARRRKRRGEDPAAG